MRRRLCQNLQPFKASVQKVFGVGHVKVFADGGEQLAQRFDVFLHGRALIAQENQHAVLHDVRP